MDTPGVVAIILGEPFADALLTRIAEAPNGGRRMSTASHLEVGTVLAGRADPGAELLAIPAMDAFLADVGITLEPVDGPQARIALRARIEHGKGFGSPAGLNFGDCFSYALAKSLNAPLLFIGEDFAQTDLAAATPPTLR